MSEKRNNGSPSVGLLLLIPAVVIAAKVASRHHRMWDDFGGPGPAMRYRGHGHHRFAGPDADQVAGREFRLPPRIEWILDTWHTRAHQSDQPADAPAS